jgi:hypothetical protein
MAISRSHSKKEPSQSPTSFYKMEQHGGAYGKPSGNVPEKLTGGPMKEKIWGRSNLNATMTGNSTTKPGKK